MPSKEERRRVKRKRRQQELRKQKNRSPAQIIAQARGPLTCYINAEWKTQGIASILCLKRLPSGSHVMGAFLVDLWCCGLKDAWGRLDTTLGEFQDMLQRGIERGNDAVAADPQLVRRLVAGGIRFARQNGFRLPPRYERWVVMLDVAPDQLDADLTDFGHEGGLLYVGPMEDLPRRLIGPVDEFLARPGVHYLSEISESMAAQLGMDVEGEPEEDEDLEAAEALAAVEEAGDMLRDRLVDKVKQWCFANAQVPHPRLVDAADVVLQSMLQVGPQADDTDQTLAAAGERLLDQSLELQTPEDRAQIAVAMDQLSAFMHGIKSPDELLETLGLGEDDEDQKQ